MNHSRGDVRRRARNERGRARTSEELRRIERGRARNERGWARTSEDFHKKGCSCPNRLRLAQIPSRSPKTLRKRPNRPNCVEWPKSPQNTQNLLKSARIAPNHLELAQSHQITENAPKLPKSPKKIDPSRPNPNIDQNRLELAHQIPSDHPKHSQIAQITLKSTKLLQIDHIALKFVEFAPTAGKHYRTHLYHTTPLEVLCFAHDAQAPKLPKCHGFGQGGCKPSACFWKSPSIPWCHTHLTRSLDCFKRSKFPHTSWSETTTLAQPTWPPMCMLTLSHW